MVVSCQGRGIVPFPVSTRFGSCDACVAAGYEWCTEDNACERVKMGGNYSANGHCSKAAGTLTTTCDGQNNTCVVLTTCAACAEAPHCGWSSVNNVCMHGDAKSPTGHLAGIPSSAADGTWLFDAAQCPHNCSQAVDCQACASLESCSWCGTVETAPQSGYCAESALVTAAECPTLAADRHVCSTTVCSAFHLPGLCFQEIGCGWCEPHVGVGSCQSGNPYGAGGSGECVFDNVGSWIWPSADAACSSYDTECGCVADATCGWCESTAQCLSITAQRLCPAVNVTDGGAANPNWHPPCASYATGEVCNDCTQAPGDCCGFCVSSGDQYEWPQCLGVEQQSEHSLCHAAAWTGPGDSCGPCVNIKNKCECLQNTECESWCETSQQCFSSQSGGECIGASLENACHVEGLNNDCSTCLESGCCG